MSRGKGKRDDDVCPKCWRASCRGNCETPAERRAREDREAAAAAADRMRKERR